MSYNSSREARRRRKRRRKILQAVIPVAVAMLLIGVILLIAQTTGLFDEWGYSDKAADLHEYFKSTSDDTASLIENCEVTDDKITVKDGRLYVPYETVVEKYNDNFYLEASNGNLLYTTGDGVYTAVPGETYYTLEGTGIQAGYPVCYTEGDTLMVCLDYVRVFTNFEYQLFGGGKEPYRAEIKTEWGSKVVADVSKDNVAIRTEPDKNAEVLKELRKGNTVEIVG